MVWAEVTLEAFVRLVLTIVVMYFWTDNLLRAYREWHREPDRESLRAFLIGFVIEMGMFSFLSGAVAFAFPSIEVLPTVTRLFSLMTTGALLVVGIWTWLLWRKP